MITLKHINKTKFRPGFQSKLVFIRSSINWMHPLSSQFNLGKSDYDETCQASNLSMYGTMNELLHYSLFHKWLQTLKLNESPPAWPILLLVKNSPIRYIFDPSEAGCHPHPGYKSWTHSLWSPIGYSEDHRCQLT